MANSAYILIVSLLCYSVIAKGQNADFKQVDSTSYAQYQAGQWPALITYGKQAIDSGVDYPLLRLRIAYAQLSAGDYSGALVQYQYVLKHDSHDQTARYFSLLCNKYLGRTNEASYQARFIDTGTLTLQHLNPFGALEAGLETGLKIPDSKYRGVATYNRLFFSNRLGWRLQLDQSVAYFTQRITNNTGYIPPEGMPGRVNTTNSTFTDGQFEYYAKLGYTINSKLTALGAYHYLGINYGKNTYSNHITLLGLTYSAPYVTLQGDVNTSDMVNSHVTQFNAQAGFYPLGNQNLYFITRGSLQNDHSQVIFSQTLGFKVAKPLWLQASASIGKMDNYMEADALYVYNAIDITKFKAGISLFYALGQHTIIYINDTFERKQDYYQDTYYHQHSITGGFKWKF